MADNDTLCYEAIQRVYRNAVVGHIRECFTHAYGAAAEDHLRRPFAKEWDKIKASAEERRHTGELECGLQDEFDLLGVNHFFNLLDAEYDRLVISKTPVPDQQQKQDKQAILGWAKTIKALRDPLAHPAEEDFTYEDAFILVDSARRLLVRLGLSAAADQVRALRDQLAGAPGILLAHSEPLESFLPTRESIVVDFVGRAGELEALWRWFDDPLSRRWALAGDGGKGKSALAYNFATQVMLRAPEPYQLVFWLGAKRRRFVEGTVSPITTPDFHDLGSALDFFLSRIGWNEYASAPLDTRKHLVVDLLNNFPALVVVDDIDSLEGLDEAALEFFTLTAPTTKSKILLTSRRVVFGMGASTTQVSGFAPADARRFITSRCALMGVAEGQLGEAVLRRIVEVAEGSPLYIEDLLRLMTVIPPSEAIKVWAGKGGDEARAYALGREIELLSPRAKEVLLAASTTAADAASLAELEAVTGLGGDPLWSALGELQKLYLIPRPQLVEGDYRFAVNINTRRLVTHSFASSEVLRRIQAARKNLSGQVPPLLRERIGPIIIQAVLYVRRKNYVQAEELLRSALDKYPNDPSLLGHLGWVYKAWEPPRVTDAREKFRRAHQLKNQDPEMYLHWSRMEAALDEWGKASEAAEKGLALPGQDRNARLLQAAGYARSRSGRELLGALQQERGEAELQEAANLLDRGLRSPDAASDPRLLSMTYRSLVLTVENLGQLGRIRGLVDAWRRHCPDDLIVGQEATRLNRRHPGVCD